MRNRQMTVVLAGIAFAAAVNIILLRAGMDQLARTAQTGNQDEREDRRTQLDALEGALATAISNSSSHATSSARASEADLAATIEGHLEALGQRLQAELAADRRANIQSADITRTSDDTTYEVCHPSATIRLSNMRVNGQPNRSIRGDPSEEELSIEFDYFLSHPKSGNIVQLIIGVGTYAETFDVVFQGIPGPQGNSGHYKGTLAVPTEVRESVKLPGSTAFGATLYFTTCYNKAQAFQYIKNGTYDCLQFRIARVKYE